MLSRLVFAVLALALLIPAGMTQNSEIPTIAVLRWSADGPFDRGARGILDMLQAYGLVSEAERGILDEGDDLAGENLNIIWRSAGSDIPTTNLMVEEALDKGVDVIMTSGTSVAQIAVNATVDLEDPPAVLFHIVSAPYSAGIAEAPCIKPDHVSGATPVHPYGDLLDAVVIQDPDISVVGTFITPGMAQSERSDREISEQAEARGLRSITAPVNSFPDIPLATQVLLDEGVEAILVSMNFVLFGIPSVVNEAADHNVPVYSPIPGFITDGAPIGVGFNDHYHQGVIAARMLLAFLNEGASLSRISIAEVPDLTYAVNYDSAADMGIEISDELAALATMTIRDGEVSFTTPPPQLPQMSLEERMAADAAYLESLRCTDEMIAEQQAQLDAANG